MKIIHLKQVHKPPTSDHIPTWFFECIVESQFNIAQFILTHSDYPVVKESLYENAVFSPDETSGDINLFIIAANLFPNGFPDKINQLNSIQKKFICEFGAPLTLFYLGAIPKIYKSIDRVTSDRIDEEVENLNFNNIYKIREEKAIFYSKKAAIKHFGNTNTATVILVYGAKHEFKPYCDKEEFEYEGIDTNTLIEVLTITIENISLTIKNSTLEGAYSELEITINREKESRFRNVSMHMEKEDGFMILYMIKNNDILLLIDTLRDWQDEASYMRRRQYEKAYEIADLIETQMQNIQPIISIKDLTARGFLPPPNEKATLLSSETTERNYFKWCTLV